MNASLALQVQVANTLDQKLDTLIPFLKSRTGPAIIYVTLQKHTEEVAGHLRPHGMKPMVYHAGLNGDERARVQQQFMESDNGIVCATIAFGMGIDKGESFVQFKFRSQCLDWSKPTSARWSTCSCRRLLRIIVRKLAEQDATVYRPRA